MTNIFSLPSFAATGKLVSDPSSVDESAHIQKIEW
jgi:hypothetical protein